MCTHIHLTCRHCIQTYPKYSSILPCLPPTQRLNPHSYSPHHPSRLSVVSLPPNSPTAATRPSICIPQRPPGPRFAYTSKALPPRRTHRPYSTDSPTVGLHHPAMIRTPTPRPHDITTSPLRMHITRASSWAHPLTVPLRTSSLPPIITHANPPKPSSLRIITHAAPLNSHPTPLPPLPQHPQTPRSPHQKPDSDPRIATKCPRYTNRWSYVTCSTCSGASTRNTLNSQTKNANSIQADTENKGRAMGNPSGHPRGATKQSLRFRLWPLAKYERPHSDTRAMEEEVVEGRRRSWKEIVALPVMRTTEDDGVEKPKGRRGRGRGCVMM